MEVEHHQAMELAGSGGGGGGGGGAFYRPAGHRLVVAVSGRVRSPESPSSGYGSNNSSGTDESNEASVSAKSASKTPMMENKAPPAVISVSTTVAIKTERAADFAAASSQIDSPAVGVGVGVGVVIADVAQSPLRQAAHRRRSTAASSSPLTGSSSGGGGITQQQPIASPSPSSSSSSVGASSTSSSSAAPSSAAMHPISLSLLHSPHTAPGSLTNPFYSASAASSASSPSPLKRSRHHHHHHHHLAGNNNGPPSNQSTNNIMEDWLPSPGQMSVDSMSPQPPPSSSSRSDAAVAASAASGVQLANGLSSVISSSNGYSPSPMSTGSYEPPFSPGGASKLGREDLSPPGSVNGGNTYSVDSFGDAKKKKGPVPRQQEELCLVCGDRASGYHYNALTCEGCKGFFRRSITKNAVYQCKYGNSCDIDMYMRRKCQECRLKKCLTVGMRPECVVPEYQCAVKREAKKAQKEKDRPALGSPESKDADAGNKQVHHHHHPHHSHQVKGSRDSFAAASSSAAAASSSSASSASLVTAAGDSRRANNNRQVIDETSKSSCGAGAGLVIKPLSPEQEELINRLVYFQEEFDQPSEEDLRKISTSGMHESDSEAKFKHITEMTILTVQLTVEFSKRLPGFDTLLREDQITLLKACSSEVMMLRCARRYDANTDSIVFANNLPYTRDSYNMAGVGDTADPLFRFGKQMSIMKVDNAEYALLTAIVIFSERPGLVEARKVEKIQEIYLEALQAYVMNHRVRPMTEFAKLLSVLTELRTLGNLNSEMCFSLKLKNKKLPPFLAEIWDVHS